MHHAHDHTPVLIVGATAGGVAAALACARAGVRCTLTEPLAWVGGQLTSQAVPPDENRWVETHGSTATYREFRRRVRDWYRAHRELTPEAAADPLLNPGGGWVSRLCFEPRVGQAVLRDMLAPHVLTGVVTVRHGLVPVAADAGADRIRAVTFADVAGSRHTISARLVLDATDRGDLYPLAGVEHAIGAESQRETGELHARIGEADPFDQQPITWCFALAHEAGADHTIAKPDRYDFWRAYVPAMTPPWPGPLLSYRVPAHDAADARTLALWPDPHEPPHNTWELWRYRQIVDRTRHARLPGGVGSSVTLVNWVQNDYWLRPTLGVSDDDLRRAEAEAREQSHCLLHWLQTEAPRHDGGTGYPGLRAQPDVLGTGDGFAMQPYVREPRRLRARTILTEAHLGTEQRRREGRPNQDATEFGSAEPFADSIAIGHYHIDLHPSTSGRNNVYVPAAPFGIPLGALVPRRVRNLLAAGKALGVTHITNGATRMHPTEWAVGEAAGIVAAHALSAAPEPIDDLHALADARGHIEAIRQRCTDAGAPTAWPWEA